MASPELVITFCQMAGRIRRGFLFRRAHIPLRASKGLSDSSKRLSSVFGRFVVDYLFSRTCDTVIARAMRGRGLAESSSSAR